MVGTSRAPGVRVTVNPRSEPECKQPTLEITETARCLSVEIHRFGMLQSSTNPRAKVATHGTVSKIHELGSGLLERDFGKEREQLQRFYPSTRPGTIYESEYAYKMIVRTNNALISKIVKVSGLLLQKVDSDGKFPKDEDTEQQTRWLAEAAKEVQSIERKVQLELLARGVHTRLQ